MNKTRMQKHDLTSAVYDSDAKQLLQIISVNENTSIRWAPADLAAIFRHQLNAALDFDLSAEALQGATTAAALKELPRAEKSGISTFGKLFLHPEPPIGLLKLSKDFFKRIAGVQPQDCTEHQVAYIFYLLSVIVTRLRHRKRITNLSDSELLKGLDWALKQAWVEKSILKVLIDARPVFARIE